MQKVPIPISGIDRQVDELSPSDGSCLQIDKFRPSGRVDDPSWQVIPNPDEYTFAPDENWSDPENTDFTIVKIHYAFDTWYAFVFFDDGGEQTALYSCTFAAGVLTLDDELFNAGSSLWIDSGSLLPIEVYFKDFGEDAFYMLITPGKEVSTGQHQLWKITPDGAEPAVHRPELHLIQVTVNGESKSTTTFDVLYPSDRKVNAVSVGAKNFITDQNRSQNRGVRDYLTGVSRSFRSQLTLPSSPSQGDVVQGSTYPGILKDKDKYFGVITAFKHPNGEWVKHSQPYVFYIEGVASFGTNTEYATLSFGKNSTYTDNDTNYDANIGDNFELYGHTGGAGSTPWKELGEVGIFMTTGKTTRDEAYLEGTYYMIGTLDENEELNWSENEETIVTGEVLNIDPYSHHVVTSKVIGSYGSNLVMVRSVTNFALPGWERHGFQSQGLDNNSPINPKINETWAGDSYTVTGPTTVDFDFVNEECAVRVTIETEKGTFYRWNTISIPYHGNSPGSQYRTILDGFLSYPDRQATQLDYYWHDFASSGDHYNFLTLPLKPHPFLNLAYNLISESDVFARFDFRVVLLTVGATEVLDFSTDNNEMMVEENEFKISDLTKLFFPLEWSYQVNDKISAVVNNTNEVGQGQFGSYPLYIFGENSIYGALGGDGVLIAKFDQISNQHGMNGFESFAVFKNILYFVSNHGIHALSGIQIEDIYDLVEDLSVHFITTNPTTKIPFFEDGSNLVANSPVALYSNILSEVQVGVNPKTREIVFSGNGGLLIFNEKYRQWYTYTVNGEGDGSNPYEFAQYDQLLYKEGDLHILESPFVPKNATILQWGTGTASGFVSLVTNPMVLTNFGLMKRLRQSLLQGTFIINGVGSDPGNGLYALNVTLEGKRSTHDDWERIISYTEDTVKTIKSFYIKSNAGSYQAFRLVINGDDLAEGTVISNFLCEFIDRGRRFRR